MTGLILPGGAPRGSLSGIPAHLQRHFTIQAPLATHWRWATCAEKQCRKWVEGYEIRIDVSDKSDLVVARLKYIRDRNIGPYTEYKDSSGWAVFRFPPFTRVVGHKDYHRIRIERPELFQVTDGMTGQTVTHRGREAGAVDWVDQFAEHQDKLASKHREG